MKMPVMTGSTKRNLSLYYNMWNFKKFANNAEYAEYLKSEDVWLPRVSYILNNHIPKEDPWQDTSTDWST
jgi:hypothetical protein